MNDFELFWKAYPKKKNKPDALKAFNAKKNVRPPIDKLLEVIMAFCKTEDWQKEDGKYIPYPASFLRGERWEDEMEVKLPEVVNGKPWHETWPGIVAKGRELGIDEKDYTEPQKFRAAVIKAANEGLKVA